jgi:cellulose synthase/poly-beta-1,6-N-acetylglucosamine synthase-like glycosyltransferase
VLTLLVSLLYVWVLCNVPALAAGLKRIPERKQKNRGKVDASAELPSFSVVVPVKDEEKVVKRILNALLNLDYPVGKVETIVVDDGSTDGTTGICRDYVGRFPGRILYLRRPFSSGKPSALNYAFLHAKGEIIATFDADNVPRSDALRVAAKYFEDPSVDAVQGRIDSINADENMLTKCVSQEMAIFYDAYLRGKAALDLFVPLAGTCQFIRRKVLVEAGGWEEESLSEDMELSVRLIEKGCRIGYAPEIRTWQEYPASISGFLRQRTRWFRGCMGVALRYGKLLTKVNRQCFDAEVMLFGSYMFLLCFFCLFLGVFTFFVPSTPLFASIVQVTSLLIVACLLFSGAAMFYAAKPRRLANVLWIPFLIFYVAVQSCISFFALLQILFNKPKKWTKTTKTGRVTVSAEDVGSVGSEEKVAQQWD